MSSTALLGQVRQRTGSGDRCRRENPAWTTAFTFSCHLCGSQGGASVQEHDNRRGGRDAPGRGIGRWPDRAIAQARAHVRTCRQRCASGNAPLERPRRVATSGTGGLLVRVQPGEPESTEPRPTCTNWSGGVRRVRLSVRRVPGAANSAHRARATTPAPSRAPARQGRSRGGRPRPSPRPRRRSPRRRRPTSRRRGRR